MSGVIEESSAAPVLEATGLCKTYALPHKTVEVLRDASFAVRAGEIVAIVGRSGAGKSTLLNILGGLDEPDAGEVRLLGQPLFSLSRSRRTALRASTVGYVFQAYHLLPEMTILENVMLPAMALGRLSRAQMRERAAALLARAGLAARASHRPMELSGGEQQRAAVARALMNAPRLVLADEPTGNLDGATGGAVLDLLFDMVRSGAGSLVVVTHDPAIAARCDRTAVLADGSFAEPGGGAGPTPR